jgi:acrylyl-CoA reductase (NADPH)
VTGATGGVGSVAIALLAKLGYQVVAATGKTAEQAYLKGLGAQSLIDRAELSAAGKPLVKERWAGVVDAVGSHTLANALAQTRYGGAVAACGLAQGFDLPTTVMPFILRGVNLLGIGSVAVERAPRLALWQRLATDLAPRHLDRIVTRVVSLTELPQAFATYLDASHTGRTLVHVNTEAL